MIELVCPSCKANLFSMRVVAAYPCFGCMKLFYFDIEKSMSLLILGHIKRKRHDSWQIGGNKQLQTNNLWEEELEALYTIWIGKKVLE